MQYLGQFSCLIHQLERSYSNELANQISVCLERYVYFMMQVETIGIYFDLGIHSDI